MGERMLKQRKGFSLAIQLLVLAVLFLSGVPSNIFSDTGNFKLVIKPGQSHDGPFYDIKERL